METKEALFVNQWEDETEKEKGGEDEVESLDEVAEEEEKEDAYRVRK